MMMSSANPRPIKQTKINDATNRASAFCARFGLRSPILLAPMAGASAPTLSIAVANAGGLGACGVLMMRPEEIARWADEVKSKTDGGFQLNTWIPDPPPVRDAVHETHVREFLGQWGPPVPESAGAATPPDFTAQCEAMLQAGPAAISSVMGLFPAEYVARLKESRIAWFAAVTTVKEARAAEAAGADVIVVQGSEAGGHRACFDSASAERTQVGLFSLLPAVVDTVSVPVIATGGIADARGIAAALILGASAVQIGTAFLRCPEAGIHPAWANALAKTAPEDTLISRVFSGRAGRSIATEYVLAAISPGAPTPAPYPVQRGLTASMRTEAQKTGDVQRIQAWAGQSASLGESVPAGVLVQQLWSGTRALLIEAEGIRADYLPPNITTLFVGESAPAKRTFFYAGDTLTDQMGAALGLEDLDRKAFLWEFKRRGWYLDDLVIGRSVNDIGDDAERLAICRAAQDDLTDRIRRYRPGAVVSLKRTIEDIVRDATLAAAPGAKFFSAPFPGSGNRSRFITAIQKILPELPRFD